MFRLVAAVMFIGLLAQAGEAVKPSQLYVVTQSFSDFGPQFFYRIVDVKQDGSDSIIRYVRLAQSNLYCAGWPMIVQAVERRITGKTPSDLFKRNNPCAVNPDELHIAARKYARKEAIFESSSFGIVAQCGSSSLALDLPVAAQIDLKRMKVTRRKIAQLWELAAQITSNLSEGDRDVFQDSLGFQQDGEKVVPALLSGKYDGGLIEATRGNAGTWPPQSFRDLLDNYKGPITAGEIEASVTPQLVDAGAYRFTNFMVPKYPRLALLSRLQGKVELRVRVQTDTGEVKTVSATSGHPLLKPHAVEAVRQWRFAPNSVPSEEIDMILDFALRCRQPNEVQ